MEQEAQKLAVELVERLETSHPSSRLLVGISGIPASGKSTFALLLTSHINELLVTGKNSGNDTVSKAILVGLDGWHLTRAQLDKFPDPKLAHDRRGSHWTFDGPGYVAFVRSLRQAVTADTPVITAPSFDHAIKDPAFDSITIYPYHRIIIVEGLYTFLSTTPWKEAAQCLDERWFIEVDFNEAKERLVRRHVVTGISKDAENALHRAEDNDIPNGRFIIANMLEPTRIIRSIDDPLLKAV